MERKGDETGIVLAGDFAVYENLAAKLRPNVRLEINSQGVYELIAWNGERLPLPPQLTARLQDFLERAMK